jgi:biopolymer transport protein TolR
MKAGINVTPLVDIVLVLLIIFIVITPAVNDAVRLPVARRGSAPEDGRRVLVLALAAHRTGAGRVDGPGLVTLDARAAGQGLDDPGPWPLADPAARERLATRLRRALGPGQDLKVLVKADLDLPFKHVDALLRLCREAGAREASLVTRDPGKG